MTSTEEHERESEVENELREFVHLDSLSVNSLLASLYMSVPETVEKAFEQGESGQNRSQAEAGLTLSNLLRLGGLKESTDSEHETQQTTVGSRINDQYRFTVLYEALQSRGKICDLTGENPEVSVLSPGDIVKIEGNCNTDPLYRVFGIASLLEEEPASQLEWLPPEEEHPDNERDNIYNGMVGLKLEPKNDTGPFGMVVKEDELWIDSRREFLGPQEYTVLARVEGKIVGENEWDLIDALRILGSILPVEELHDQRERILDGIFESVQVDQDTVDQIVMGVLWEELEEGRITIHNLEEEERRIRKEVEEHFEQGEEVNSSELDPTDFMDRDEFTLDDGYIVNPIAIYW